MKVEILFLTVFLYNCTKGIKIEGTNINLQFNDSSSLKLLAILDSNDGQKILNQTFNVENVSQINDVKDV